MNMPIRDQRSMTGPGFHGTVPEVVAAWASAARQAGIQRPAGWEGRTGLLEIDVTLEAYVSAGRWVANCPCGGGVACWQQNPRGACLTCGRIYQIRFPRSWRKIEQVLESRPVQHQNYLPGETLKMLRAENIHHGVEVL